LHLTEKGKRGNANCHRFRHLTRIDALRQSAAAPATEKTLDIPLSHGGAVYKNLPTIFKFLVRTALVRVYSFPTKPFPYDAEWSERSSP
jgi:hypothetical protein